MHSFARLLGKSYEWYAVQLCHYRIWNADFQLAEESSNNNDNDINSKNWQWLLES